MVHVLVTGKIAQEGLDILQEFGRVTVVENPSEEDIAPILPTVDAVLHKIGKLPRELLLRGPGIQIIARHGVGLDDLDLEYLKEKGIKLTITEDANSHAVAEFTVTLMLVLNRRLFEAHEKLIKQGFWQREQLIGQELQGQVLGLIGFGRIGKRVALLAQNLGMKIMVHDPFLKEVPPGATLVGLDELLTGSDIISIHCPLTSETKNLLNTERLGLLKPTAYLVNTARGGIIDEKALFTMLKEKRLAGAALDVFSVEPPSLSSELQTLSNLIVTPHISAMTHSAQRNMAIMAAREIKKFFLGG
ncbi:MAG: D-3-phosphoglycerate dehydrogenase / 2-oxoglutarate reductase [Clostridia bacterium]|nr:D-3-phosphoglycerate dehydrogenase / 2-oxoglutarate reductase [Clostridia bacterium]